MPTIPEFRERFPEYENVPDARVRIALDEAALIMSDPDKWLDFYDVANLYLTAHLLFLAEKSATGDPGASYPANHQEVDDVVVKFAVKPIDPMMDDLYTTSYGKQYIKYRRMAFTGIYGV